MKDVFYLDWCMKLAERILKDQTGGEYDEDQVERLAEAMNKAGEDWCSRHLD